MNINHNTKPDQTTALTSQQAQAIGAAYARLLELKKQSVLTVNTESEVRGLIEFLSTEFLAHASEFLACWFIAKTEYEPALHVLSVISARVSAIQSARQSAKSQIVQLHDDRINEKSPATN